MIKKICFSTIIAFTSITSFLSAKISYEIQDIGTLQTHSSNAISINNQGQILGWYNINSSENEKHFFLRDKEGEFYELPSRTLEEGTSINWRFLTGNGKVYGTFSANQGMIALCEWDLNKGYIELGVMPGKDVVNVNNLEQVLIKSIQENENGNIITQPVIWQNGQITKLNGLIGDVGIQSQESFGHAINNNGDVVGQSETYIVYKNEIFKQVHAVMWANGEIIDLHKSIPKCSYTQATSINDLGDVIVNGFLVNLKGERVPQYLNYCRVSDNNYFFSEAMEIIFDRNGQEILIQKDINKLLSNDHNSIWLNCSKIIGVNDKGEVIGRGTTIYGEQHALLLVPVINDTELDESDEISPDKEPNQEISKETLNTIINGAIDAAFILHTGGIEEKVRLLFLEVYAQDQNTARQVSGPYRKILMLEALDKIIIEVEKLSVAIHYDKDTWFWKTVQLRLNEKHSGWKLSVDSYIMLKLALLGNK